MSVNELREQLREYDKLYRAGKPALSDTQYDKLFDELKRIEAESGGPVPADSPTQTIGSNLLNKRETAFPASTKQVKHTVPMLSIENVYSDGELLEFGNKAEKRLTASQASGLNTQWVVELKIDGVSLALIYENGKLKRGITRGNGSIGEDVSHNLDMIVDIPKTLTAELIPSLEIRGEVYMLNSDLGILNESQPADKKYKNARNITTGTISLKDPKEETNPKKKQEILAEHKRRKLHFFAHSTGMLAAEPVPATHYDFLQHVKQLGIPVAPHTEKFDSFEKAAAYCKSLYETDESFLNELDFEIDGLVLKVNGFKQQEILGATGHHPRWVIAYKVEKYEAETTVKDIRVQIGKAGTITPVAELEPVEIAGTTVSRASLHNAEEIERKDIRIGDTVVVEKAGKIIPHITRMVSPSRLQRGNKFEFPTHCPVCGSPLSKDTDGVYIRCNNSSCSAQFKEKLKYFAGRSAMDIEGLGDKLIDQLVDSGLVKTFGDLYRLKDRKEELVKRLYKDAKKKKDTVAVDKLLVQIEKSKQRELRFLVNALCIRNVGSSTARDLAAHFGTLNRLRNASEAELLQIENIGEVVAKSIIEFFQNEKELLDDIAENFQTLITAQPPVQSEVPQPLAGQTIVVTGTLEHFKRNEIEDIITQHGGKASSSVSAKTSFVLVGKDPGSKFDKAQKLGVKVVNEMEFMEMLKPV
ncbi:MAG: NAD-dependent DNA ligase LigA [Planctomycetaceae bacterium]|jgi:DNA ligase (NAD+)|nr:NAD-dependent DNA ligase LigA [Planctomycetaceae bacterium]